MSLDLMTGHYPGYEVKPPVKRLKRMTFEIAEQVRKEWNEAIERGEKPVKREFAKRYGANETTIGKIVMNKSFVRER